MRRTMRLPLAIALALAGCGAGTGEAPARMPEPPGCDALDVEIGPGEIQAWRSDGDLVALCIGGEDARVTLVDTLAGTAEELGRPFGPEERCDAVAIGADRVCVAGYESGVACVGREAGAPARRFDLGVRPTGIAWDGEAFWIATDCGGIWTMGAGDPERRFDLPDLTAGIVAGTFGAAWGTGGEYAWRTRIWRRGTPEPEWIRPRPPPGVDCESEIETCEWLSSAAGVRNGWIYFSSHQAPAPLYRMNVESGRFQEFQVPGDVLVSGFGVLAVDADGIVRALDESRDGPSVTPAAEAPERTPWMDAPPPQFADTGLSMGTGDVPISASHGLYAARDGRLRLVAGGTASAPCPAP